MTRIEAENLLRVADHSRLASFLLTTNISFKDCLKIIQAAGLSNYERGKAQGRKLIRDFGKGH